MPNFKSIFLAKLFIISILFLQSIHCQADVIALSKADSLFDQRSYKEAMEIYQSNFQLGVYSPAMLLKMSFIAEGIGDKENATRYLSKYYDLNPNPQTLTKIKSLTGQSNLVGYEVSDLRRFILFLVEYREFIIAALAIFLLVSLIFLWITLRKYSESSNYWPTILLIVVLFLANNFLVAPSAGLVTSSPTLIVDQPTAGGELIEQVEPGHRVKIKSTKDVWFEVEWKDRVGYIKKSDVTRL